MIEMRLVIRLALGIVFLLSSGGKLRDVRGFARGVQEYGILSSSLASVAALFIIALEGALAIMHLTGWLLPIGVPLGLCVLAIFVAVIGANLARGRSLPCYCFGGRGGETISGRTLARLLLLFSGEAFLLLDRTVLVANRFVNSHQVVGQEPLVLGLFWAAILLLGGLWVWYPSVYRNPLKFKPAKCFPCKVRKSLSRVSKLHLRELKNSAPRPSFLWVTRILCASRSRRDVADDGSARTDGVAVLLLPPGKVKVAAVSIRFRHWQKNPRTEELYDKHRDKVWKDIKSGTESLDKYMLTSTRPLAGIHQGCGPARFSFAHLAR